VPDLLLHQPRSLAEACATLARYDGAARAIAGGTALVLMLRQGLLAPPALVRLDAIPGLDTIAEVDGTLRLGALATLSAVAASPLVRARVPVLAAACALVGNVRVRNAATLGGNLCEADYASDPPGVLVALDARVRIHGPHGARELPVAALVRDFYETALAPDELVTEVCIPLPAPTGVYLKYVTRSAEDRPCVGVTALVRHAADGRLAEARVAVGAVAGRPLRLPAAEALAHGAVPDEALFHAIGQAYAAAAEPVSDARGSAAYRQQMVAVFVRRALRAAAAGQQGAWRV
jgi:carbon-monoxide dehydrogenase medium subunit